MDYKAAMQNLEMQIRNEARNAVLQERMTEEAKLRVAELQGKINMLSEIIQEEAEKENPEEKPEEKI